MCSYLILVVEDNPINRRLLQVQLASEGWQSEVVETGAAALSWLRKRHADKQAWPSAMVTDYVLEDMTGVQLLHRVREWEVELAGADAMDSTALAPIPVRLPLPMILYSGMSLDFLKTKSRGLDCLAIITKPIGRRQLRDALSPLINRRTSTRYSFARSRLPNDPSPLAESYNSLSVVIADMPMDLLIELLQFGEEGLICIRNSLRIGALDQAASVAHGIRGAAGILRCVQIAQSATEIETQARLGIATHLDRGCNHLQIGLEHLRRHIAFSEQVHNTQVSR
ncbi:Hpt domain-containing response regulator [Glaciimonas sp. GNP009]|uniref:Hpt domain-containing response regulator n=2 Tax=Glaciimonas sp. CA11.2 TaxID=3048601 RepID=UPI002AB50A73|nr:response regulator [Glaciimonas sp. CA11.2]MDY7548049.1 response regulator [Glaciimonas sp. CA11.2]